MYTYRIVRKKGFLFMQASEDGQFCNAGWVKPSSGPDLDIILSSVVLLKASRLRPAGWVHWTDLSYEARKSIFECL